MSRNLQARIYNFPNRMVNLQGTIRAMKLEAERLGFNEEARLLKSLSVMAGDWQPPEPRKIEWTQSEVNLLSELWANGYTAASISKRLGKTRPAVLAAARRHNLERRR